MSANPQATATGTEPTLVRPGNFVAHARVVAMGNGVNWLASALPIFSRAAGGWIGMVVAYLLIIIVAHLIPFIGAIAIQILWPVFVGGLMIASRTIDEGGQARFSQLFAGFRQRTGTLVTLGVVWLVVSFLIVAIVIGITGVSVFGLMAANPEQVFAVAATALLAALLILALMLPLVMATWFAPALIVFQGMGVAAAMKASFIGSLKNVLPFLLYGVIAIVAGVIASLPFGLGWLVLGPVLTASVYTSYRDIYFE